MKNIFTKICTVITGCLLASVLYSCNGSESASGTRCADSTAAAANTTTTTTTTTVTDTSATAAGATNNSTSAGNNMADRTGKMATTKGKASERSGEPTGPAVLGVSSPAFGANGVIPIKYTCDGQGATPPLKVSNIPANTSSLTLIVHDYEATPEGGFTYWLIWNLDTAGGIIPENFRNNHEGMNAAKEYGYTPICSKSGNHKYHFIIYALDTKLVMPKTTSKKGLEDVMKGHVLGKGEAVGVYNKHLE